MQSVAELDSQMPPARIGMPSKNVMKAVVPAGPVALRYISLQFERERGDRGEGCVEGFDFFTSLFCVFIYLWRFQSLICASLEGEVMML